MTVEGQRGNTGQERNVAGVGIRILDGRSEGKGDERGDPGEDEHVEFERWVRRRKEKVISRIYTTDSPWSTPDFRLDNRGVPAGRRATDSSLGHARVALRKSLNSTSEADLSRQISCNVIVLGLDVEESWKGVIPRCRLPGYPRIWSTAQKSKKKGNPNFGIQSSQPAERRKRERGVSRRATAA